LGRLFTTVSAELYTKVALVLAVHAFNASSEGDLEEAYIAYDIIDQVLPEGHFSARLSILRHASGPLPDAEMVIPIEATEDEVVSRSIEHGIESVEYDPAMCFTWTIPGGLERNIRSFMDTFDPRFHRQNITKELPHVMVMSTGRCGTMSLYKLLKDSNLLPYHTYWWHVSGGARQKVMCRIMSGRFDGPLYGFREFLSMRAAEWLGAMANNRAMIGLNHMDTVFAPAFATMHPLSRFVYLKRNRLDLFNSFCGKSQWSRSQVNPCFYSFDPEFRFCYDDALSVPEQIAWYFHFTEEFSRAMGRVMGNRWLEVSSDKLFAQDRDEIARLLDFIGSDIPLDVAIKHFATKINAKDHKAKDIPEEALESFNNAMKIWESK
jgi:hypothetical protein